MATATYVPVELYLRSDYEPDAEYVDGEIEERPMGVYDHGSWQRAIVKWFLLHEDLWNIRIIPELRIQVGASRYRVPDVVLVDHQRPVEQILTYPPLAVFEILSPDDSITRMLIKLQDYEQMGIGAIYVVHPKQQAFYRFVNGSLQAFEPSSHVIGEGPYAIDWRVVAGYLT